MNRNEALDILKEMQDEIERMTDDQLFHHLIKSSETFRREIDNVSLKNPALNMRDSKSLNYID